jgi:hypothetical protein
MPATLRLTPPPAVDPPITPPPAKRPTTLHACRSMQLLIDKLEIFAWTSYEYVPNETDNIERYIVGN